LIEEDPGSINDDFFLEIPSNPNQWVDLPASYHNNGSGISFADGHSQIKRWTDKGVLSGAGIFTVRDPTSSDLTWLQARATSHK
jgi:prepilin-type processing-associated H-X9-DG protein